MIIKNADSKENDIHLLQSLLNHSQASAETKKRIDQEIRYIQAGVKGEKEAAYEMQVHYADSKNWMVLHDLRIEHGGLSAQIDHLLINRWLDVWVCESKHFSEGVSINEHGEFVGFFRNKPYGVPSPIEQNHRHILILKKLFESGIVELPTRMGLTLRPSLKSLILVSKNARISRPKAKVDGVEAVIKSDQLFKRVDKAVDDMGPLLSVAKVVGVDTLERLGRDIAKLHKPHAFDWHAKFGLPPLTKAENTAIEQTQGPAEGTTRQKLICHGCNAPIPFNVAKFCWLNKPRFGGQLFCRLCQEEVGKKV